MRDWAALVKQASFTGDGSSTLFNLPADWGRAKDQSGWDRTNAKPMQGPLSSPQWQYLKAWTSSSNVTILYRIVGNRMEFYTAPANGDVIYCDYLSRYWVASDGASTGDKYQPSASGDVVLLEPMAVTRLLKCKWLEAIGEDSTAARQEFLLAFDGAASNEPAPVLSMAGPSIMFPRIGVQNLPDTGYGA